MNPFGGLVNSAMNYLNPQQPGNIWNSPVMRAIQPILTGGQKVAQGAVNAGRNMAAGTYNIPAQAINQTLQQTNQALQQNRGNPVAAARQATGSLFKNTAANPSLLSEEASFAVPFGRGANFLTKSVLPGALSGAIYQAGQPGATPKNIGENAIFGGAFAGALQGMGNLAMKGNARLDALATQHPELQSGQIDFNAPIGGEPQVPLQPGEPIRGEPVFDSRPAHQVLLEQAWNNNDLPGAQKIIDAIPANDPYKGTMQHLQDIKTQPPPMTGLERDAQHLMQESNLKPPAVNPPLDIVKNPNTLSPLGQQMENINKVTTQPGLGQKAIAGANEFLPTPSLRQIQQAATLNPAKVANPKPLPGAVNDAEKSLTPSVVAQKGKDLFNPEAKQQSASMFQRATTEKPVLDNAFGAIAQKSGATFDSRIKAPDTMLQKIILKRAQGRSYDLQNVNDIYGGRITVTSPDQFQSVLQQIQKTGLKIISSEPVKTDTYNAYHVDFQTPTGMKGEIQIMTPQQSAESLVNHGIRSQYGEKPAEPIQTIKEQNANVVKQMPPQQAQQVADSLLAQSKANPEMASQPIALKPPEQPSFLNQQMAEVNKATQPSALSQFESQAAKAKQESMAYFDQQGNKMYQTKPGGKVSARIPTSDVASTKGAVMTSHNHVLPDPNNPDSLVNQVASMPNKYDIQQAVKNGVKEVRTVTPNGTVSMKLPDNLNSQVVQKAFQQSSIEGENAYRASLARGESKYMANVMRVKAENDALVGGLNAQVTKTGAAEQTPIQKAASFLKSPEAQSGKVNFLAGVKTPFSAIGKIFNRGKQSAEPLSGAGTGIEKPRGFVQTVQESPQAPQKLKDLVSGSYNVKANTSLIDAANQRIAKSAEQATHFATTINSDESTATAIQLVKKLSSEGNHQAAADIVNTKAEQLTEAGRTIQAASLFDSLSPEGVGQLAARTIQKYNIAARNKIPELTGNDLKAVQDMAAKIKTLPDGSRMQDQARQQLLQTVARLVPSSATSKALAIWRTGLLTGPQTIAKIGVSHAAMSALEQIKNIPAAAVDKVVSLFSKQKGLSLTSRGLISGGKQGINDAVDSLFKGYEAPNSGGFARDFRNTVNFGNSPFGKAAQAYVDTVGKLHGAVPKPFYGAAHLNSLYDQALTTAANQHLTGGAADNFVVDAIKSPTPEMLKVAARDAQYATFQQKTMLGQAASAGMRPLGAAGKIIAPFTRIASSVITDAIDYAPTGAVKSVMQAINRGQFTQDSQRLLSQGLGRTITGTGLLAIGAALYNKGMIALDRPKGKAAAQWDLEGRKPQSIKIDGQWKNLAALGPLGHVLGMGGYFQQGLTANGLPGAMGSAGAGLAKITVDQPYLMGVSNLVQAVQNPQQAALTEEKSLAGSVVPTIAGTVARALDPLQRETNTPAEAMQAKVPFLRQKLIPKTDVFGKPVQRSGGTLQNLVDPFQSYTDTSGQATGDAVTSELGRLNSAGFPATPVKLSSSQTLHGVKTKLTPAQLDQVNQTMGPQVKDAINTLMQTPKYQALTDEEKAAEIGKTVAKIHAGVRSTFNTANPKSPLPKYVKPSTAKAKTKSRGLFGSSKSSSLFSSPKRSKSQGLFSSL